MNTERNHLQGESKEQQTAADDVQISPPRIDRPEGPFEHSGDVAGQTEEEKVEKQEKEQQ